MALGFQSTAFQNNAFQSLGGVTPPPPPPLLSLRVIYIRDLWRTVLRVFNYTILLGILLGM